MLKARVQKAISKADLIAVLFGVAESHCRSGREGSVRTYSWRYTNCVQKTCRERDAESLDTRRSAVGKREASVRNLGRCSERRSTSCPSCQWEGRRQPSVDFIRLPLHVHNAMIFDVRVVQKVADKSPLQKRKWTTTITIMQLNYMALNFSSMEW